MPGATPILGIPYPLLGENVSAADFQNFALAVDTLVSALSTRVTDDTDRPFAHLLEDNTANSVIVNVETTLVWRLGIDNDSMFSAGTPTQLTVQTAGVYMVGVSGCLVDGFATLTSQRFAIFQNGTLRFSERKSETSSSDGPETTVHGLLVCAATDTIQVRCLWTGTGGPADVRNTAMFTARYVCPLI